MERCFCIAVRAESGRPLWRRPAQDVIGPPLEGVALWARVEILAEAKRLSLTVYAWLLCD